MLFIPLILLVSCHLHQLLLSLLTQELLDHVHLLVYLGNTKHLSLEFQLSVLQHLNLFLEHIAFDFHLLL